MQTDHMEQENKIRKIVRDVIQETSLSRVWQHINNKETFGIISAYKNDLSFDENKQRHEQLREDIRKKYGYIELNSGYTYKNNDVDVEQQVKEQSFFVPKIELSYLINLGNKYEQETIIYKDENQFSLIDPKTKSIEQNFEKGNGLTFNQDNLKDAWSEFVKSKNKNNIKPFSFILKEVFLSKIDLYKAIKDKKRPEVKLIDLF